MSEHLVSVIVPVYNAAETLQRCVDSIRQQTYPHIEIILINDGSSDISGQICDALAAEDRCIRAFHQANQGPATARNTGINHAVGTYVQFVDADDFIAPTMTETLVNEMTEEVDLVICGYASTVPDKRTKRKKKHLPSIHGTFSHDEFIDHIGILYAETIFPSPCNKLYKIDILLTEHVRFMDDFHMGEDIMFNIDYMEVCNFVAIVPESLYTYVIRGQESLSTRFHQKYTQYQMHIHHHITEFLQRKNKLNGQNYVHVQRVFMKSIINSFTHLFHPGNTETIEEKKAKIETIVHDPNVQQYTKYLRGSLQAQIVRTLIEKRSINGIYNFFHVKQRIQSRAHPLYKMLKRIDTL